MRYRNIIRYLPLIMLLLMSLKGCASQPRAHINPDYAFTDISFYSLFPRHHQINDIQRLGDFQRNRIELAIEQTMDDLRFSYASEEQADVIVSYFLVQSSLKELNEYHRQVKACLVCTQNELRTLNRKIGPDMLIIDLLSTNNMRSIYRQVSSLKIKPKNTSDENQQLIVEAVQRGLADLAILAKPL
ncbi:DUF4136 domain-containing protein [Thalassotalea mangrovi]|uniref:DUF4136 domain-containing protein n=1 Tax=Thalassotalea mangrovi TaxID=2572245 RepID=A0A4U1BBA2_9GAMM|nr:DUF4136 domain-containing protein [Thalassotalea mangrovi]TKB47849.1 DUF4136 domain-containing protein [Thalassotalea mangrovi]